MPIAIKHLLMIAGVLLWVFWLLVFLKEEDPEAVENSCQCNKEKINKILKK